MHEHFPATEDDVVIVASGSVSATGRNPLQSHEAALQFRTGLRELTPADIPHFDLLAQAKGLKTAEERAAFFQHAWGSKCGVGGVIPREYFPDPADGGYPKGFYKAGEQLVGVSVLQAYVAFTQIRAKLQTLFSADEGKIRPDLAKRTMIDVASGAGSSVEMMESALAEFLLGENDSTLGNSYGKSGWLLGMLGNMSAGHLASAAGIEGPQNSSNAACASSGLSMFNAFNALRAGVVDIAIVGGSENPVGPVNTYVSFDHMMKRKGGALSRNWRNSRGAEHALTAYGADRDGFVPGNAAGLVVMMRRKIADVLRIQPLARVLGVSANTCQSRRFGKSLADGTITGQAALLEELFSSINLNSADMRGQLIHYLHATGTEAGAINELYAAAKVLGAIAQDGRYVGAGTKEGTGHPLAAALILNVIELLEAMRDQVAGFPSTQNVDPAFQEADPKILEKENILVDSPSLRAVADSIPCRRNVKADAGALWFADAKGFGGINMAVAMVEE
ncbi:MAG: beta-ketoacyl synthase N-terminal-like domain-containing protein [Candidatus Peregrinibacteria bacterium]